MPLRAAPVSAEVLSWVVEQPGALAVPVLLRVERSEEAPVVDVLPVVPGRPKVAVPAWPGAARPSVGAEALPVVPDQPQGVVPLGAMSPVEAAGLLLVPAEPCSQRVPVGEASVAVQSVLVERTQPERAAAAEPPLVPPVCPGVAPQAAAVEMSVHLVGLGGQQRAVGPAPWEVAVGKLGHPAVPGRPRVAAPCSTVEVADRLARPSLGPNRQSHHGRAWDSGEVPVTRPLPLCGHTFAAASCA